MARTHLVSCDICGEPMMFQREVGSEIGSEQAYRCFKCADRWAVAHLNSQGGVKSISYKNETDANMYLASYAAGRELGKRW